MYLRVTQWGRVDLARHVGRLTEPELPELPKSGCAKYLRPSAHFLEKRVATFIFRRLDSGYRLRTYFRTYFFIQIFDNRFRSQKVRAILR